MNDSLHRYMDNCQLTNYLPLPRTVLEMGLSSTAILLYGLLLDRGTLSKKHGYADITGWIYAVFPQEELCQRLGISPTMVKTHLRKLENAGLIRRLRLSRKEANRYYLLVPSDAVTVTGTATFSPPEGQKTVLGKGRKLPPINMNNQPDLINPYRYEEEESL